MNSNTRAVNAPLTPATIVAGAHVLNEESTLGLTPQFAEQPTQPVDGIDPHAYLRLQMRVIGGQSKVLGKVGAIERNTVTGQITALIVRHGLFGNKHTSVPVEQVKWVNQDSVVLQFSQTAFKRLPQVSDR